MKRGILISFLLFSFVSPSSAEKLYYTLQVGSFKSLKLAEKAYNRLLKVLPPDTLPYLRIEKVKGYFTVRIGRFERKRDAFSLLRRIKQRTPGAVVLSAYVLDHRIVKLYRPEILEERKHEVKEEKEGPSDKESLIKVASQLLNEQKYQEAETLLKDATARWPDEPEILYLYGATLLQTGRPREAYPFFKKAVKLSPQEADYHNGLGYSLLYQGRHFDAINEFSKAIVINPEHVDALAGLVLAYSEAGMVDLARDYHRHLQRLDPDAADNLSVVLEGE